MLIKSVTYTGCSLIVISLFQYYYLVAVNIHEIIFWGGLFLTILAIPIFYFTLDYLTINVSSYFSSIRYLADDFNIFINRIRTVKKMEDLKVILYAQQKKEMGGVSIMVWYFKYSREWKSVQRDEITLPEEAVSFLRYREVIIFSDLLYEYRSYLSTPFKKELKLVLDFMQEHSIIRLCLLQKSNEMVGIMALRHEKMVHFDFVLNQDVDQFQLIESALTYAICNITYLEYLFQHQQQLEIINHAISLFNTNIEKQEYEHIVSATLQQLLIEVVEGFILTLDKDQVFYTRRHLISAQEDDVKFYFQDVDQWFDNKLIINFSIYNDANVPVLIRNIINQFKVENCVLLRLNESEKSL